jgi:hypothetical protein
VALEASAIRIGVWNNGEDWEAGEYRVSNFLLSGGLMKEETDIKDKGMEGLVLTKDSHRTYAQDEVLTLTFGRYLGRQPLEEKMRGEKGEGG